MRRTEQVPIVTAKKDLAKLLREEIVFPLLPRAEDEWGQNAKLSELGFIGLERELIMAQIAETFGITISEREEAKMMHAVKVLEDGIWQKYWSTHLVGRDDLVSPGCNFTKQQSKEFQKLVSKIVEDLSLKVEGYAKGLPIQDWTFEPFDLANIVDDFEKEFGQEVSHVDFEAIGSYADLEAIFAHCV